MFKGNDVSSLQSYSINKSRLV